MHGRDSYSSMWRPIGPSLSAYNTFPTVRAAHAMEAVGCALFVFGGYTDTSALVRDAWALTLAPTASEALQNAAGSAAAQLAVDAHAELAASEPSQVCRVHNIEPGELDVKMAASSRARLMCPD